MQNSAPAVYMRRLTVSQLFPSQLVTKEEKPFIQTDCFSSVISGWLLHVRLVDLELLQIQMEYEVGVQTGWFKDGNEKKNHDYHLSHH